MLRNAKRYRQTQMVRAHSRCDWFWPAHEQNLDEFVLVENDEREAETAASVSCANRRPRGTGNSQYSLCRYICPQDTAFPYMGALRQRYWVDEFSRSISVGEQAIYNAIDVKPWLIASEAFAELMHLKS